MNPIREPGSQRAYCGFRVLAVILFFLLFHVDSRSQSAPASPDVSRQAKISVSTNLVVLPVSVTDSNGVFISGLRREQFHVYEEGRLQNVTLFLEEDTPVTAGIIVDRSRSMGPKLVEVAAAASTFADSSNPEDEMFVVDFSDNVTVESLGGRTFTSDARILERALSAIRARGQTALYDAVAEGLNHLALGKRDKKALIIISDGGDNASRHKFSDVLTMARQAHAVIYSIGLIGNFEEVNPRALERLCKETGGIAFFPQAGQNISEIAKAIARDLREQYTLGYSPEGRPNSSSFRKLAVRAAAPNRGRLRVRTRAGYMAPSRKTLSTLPDAGRQ